MRTGVPEELDRLARETGANREALDEAHATIAQTGYFAYGRPLDDWDALGMLQSVIHFERAALAGPPDFDGLAALAQRLQEPRPNERRSFKDGLRRTWWDR